MLDSGFVPLREDGTEVDFSAADIHHLVVRWSSGILDVHHREPAGIAIEEVERIAAAEHHPVQIHLEIDECWIGSAEQKLQWPHSLYRPYLEVVVVIGESKALRFCLRTKLVQRSG